MTHEELENYINNFRPEQRETVLKEILDSDILAKAFETKEGRVILNSAVDLISDNVMKIVKLAVESRDENPYIVQTAREINTIYKLMTDWAAILTSGEGHKDKIKEKKNG